HEATSFVVHQNATLATNPFRHENSPHTRRPHHTRGMKLHELHVLKRRACVVRERLTVAGVLPAVARYAVSAADSTRSQHHRPGDEHLEASTLPVVRERSRNAITVTQKRDHGAFHVHFDRLMDHVILQRANDLESRAIANVRKTRVLVTAEVALKNP